MTTAEHIATIRKELQLCCVHTDALESLAALTETIADTAILDWLIKGEAGPVYVKGFGWVHLTRNDLAAAIAEMTEIEAEKGGAK